MFPKGGFVVPDVVRLAKCTRCCGVINKGRLGSGVPHREPSVLHVTVEAVAGDLSASQASSQLTGEGGEAEEAEEGKSSCRMPRIGVARGERETARDRHPEVGSVRYAE